MAREIKAIQCPKCGSTQKVEIRTDYYRCTNCDTEYFLDDDDITITHNVNYNPAHTGHIPLKRPAAVIGVVFLIIIIGFLLTFWLTGSSSESPDTMVGIGKPDTEYSWRDHDVVAFTDENNMPILLMFGQRDITTGDDTSKSAKYAIYYDFLSGKEIKAERFEIPKAERENFVFKTFTNGDTYAIVNNMLLYKLDKRSMSLKPVTALHKEHPELAAGIADYDFINENYGDGMKLLTNDGKNYSYFPIANVVYDKDQVRQAERSLSIKDPKAKTRTFLDFSLASTSFPDEKIQLYKWAQKDNLGGPNDWTYFEWSSYYGHNGKLIKQPFRGTGDLLIDYKDLTPGRLYFSPKMLYYDKDYILISMNTTAGKNAKVALQCLDAKTGEIVFTYPFNEDVYLDENAIRYKDGFVAFSGMFAVAVDMEGKLVKEFKLL
ncbi:hypothetical protein AMR72_02315 [Flavobacterium psychrophilum]|nr:hypothetical protein AMR72_02315 [Flavobacterium psychrophilum]AOE51457.1 hypothetical protein ALW18_02315 [Flavobacterium psychrophilum]